MLTYIDETDPCLSETPVPPSFKVRASWADKEGLLVLFPLPPCRLGMHCAASALLVAFSIALGLHMAQI